MVLMLETKTADCPNFSAESSFVHCTTTNTMISSVDGLRTNSIELQQVSDHFDAERQVTQPSVDIPGGLKRHILFDNSFKCAMDGLKTLLQQTAPSTCPVSTLPNLPGSLPSASARYLTVNTINHCYAIFH